MVEWQSPAARRTDRASVGRCRRSDRGATAARRQTVASAVVEDCGEHRRNPRKIHMKSPFRSHGAIRRLAVAVADGSPLDGGGRVVSMSRRAPWGPTPRGVWGCRFHVNPLPGGIRPPQPSVPAVGSERSSSRPRPHRGDESSIGLITSKSRSTTKGPTPWRSPRSTPASD